MRFSETRLDVLKCADGVGRTVHVWEPEAPKGVILAIHGGMAHGGDYVTPGLYFKEQGYAMLSFDMRGHCQKRVIISKFDDFVDDCELFFSWVSEQYPHLPIFIFGHSMGGLISTHLGAERLINEPRLKGFVLSSPYYVNAIPIPMWQIKISRLLSKFVPTMQLTIDDFTEQLTHDKEITARHIQDAKDHIRASEVSVRFAQELMSAQQGVDKKLAKWTHPLYVVVSGDDKLADSQATLDLLKQVDEDLLVSSYQSQNYHENFNETNRLAIYSNILQWMESRLNDSV